MNLTEREKFFVKLRLVTTVPPPGFFGGNNIRRAHDYTAALRRLGASVYEFDTDAVYRRNAADIERQKREIFDFHPHAVIGTPNAGYVLQGGMIFETKDPSQPRRNIFLDDLELPAVLYWDHALTQAGRYWLSSFPDHPSQSGAGALKALRALFHHPRIAHLVPDTGHVAALEKLEVLSSNSSAWFVLEVAQPFAECGEQPETLGAYDEDVAFFGNLYMAHARTIPYADDSDIARIRHKAQKACAADWSLSAFVAYSNAIATLDADSLSSCALDCDQTFYWRFLFEELSRFMNGQHRFDILQSCRHPLSYFGNFNDPNTNRLLEGKVTLRGALPYDASLARTFRRTRVAVDVVNAPFINGFSPKLSVCFASGGFMLTNRRADIIRALGPIANEIFYHDAEQLNAKVDYFLTNDRQRRELTREIGTFVRREFHTEALLAKTLPTALERIGVRV